MAVVRERVVSSQGQRPDQFHSAIPDGFQPTNNPVDNPPSDLKQLYTRLNSQEGMSARAIARDVFRVADSTLRRWVHNNNLTVKSNKGIGLIDGADRAVFETAMIRGWMEALPPSDRAIIEARFAGKSLAAVRESGNGAIGPKTRWGIAKAEKRVLAMWRQQLGES